MKYIIVIFIGFLCCKGTGNNERNQSNESNDLLMPNREDSLITKVCDFFEESSEGGKVKGYYNSNGVLIRIEVELLGELGRVYKLFINDIDPKLFIFEQRYLFYDKPIYEKGSIVVDSVLVKGTARNGIIDKSINGERIPDDNIERMLSNMYSTREKYAKFLKDCSSSSP